jgi:hypothetical protein
MDNLNMAMQRIAIIDELRSEGRAVAGGSGAAGGGSKAATVTRQARETMAKALNSYQQRRTAIQQHDALSGL